MGYEKGSSRRRDKGGGRDRGGGRDKDRERDRGGGREDSTLPIPYVEILVRFPIPLLAISNHLVPFVQPFLRDTLLFVVVGQC